MKKLVIVTLSFCLTLAVQAQSKKKMAVAKAVEQLRAAMVSGDKASLESITHDKLSYGHSGGAVEDKTAFVEKIASGKSDFVSIDLAEQTISVSGKTAIVRHLLNAKTNDGGKPGEVHLKILLIFQKEGSKWKLLARQAVKVG